MKIPIAVAVYSTENGYMYDIPLYSLTEIQQVRDQEHPEIEPNYRVIIVHANLSTEDFT